MRFSPVFSLALIFIPFSSAIAQQSWPNREVPDFNLIVNDDGDFTFVSEDPEESTRALRAAVDASVNTGIKTLTRCIGAGSEVLYYPTKVATQIGWRETPRDTPMVKRSRACLNAGVDPLRILGEQCRKNGVRFIPSVRMNDAHFARQPEDHPLTGKFWLDNQQRFILPNNRLDFSHREVREYRLAIIFEVLDRYADLIDGVQLDFNRHGIYFPVGTARDNAHYLTEMVEQVRKRLADMEKQNGRSYFLLVRVSPTMANSGVTGMDVDDWMKRRLVDVVTPAQVYNLAFDMPLSDMVALAKQSGCRIYPAIYQRTQYTWPFVRDPSEAAYASDASTLPTAELIAGAASNYWHLGVDGFETYNYRIPPGPLGLQTARALSAPAVLAWHDRVYAITPAHGSDVAQMKSNENEVTQYSKQLPTEISSRPTELSLLIGEKLNDPEKLVPGYIALRLGLRDIPPTSQLRIRINGKAIHEGAIQDKLVAITGGPRDVEKPYIPLPQHYLQIQIKDLAPLRQGENKLEITMIGAGTAQGVVVEAQLGVLFDNPYPKRI